MEDGTLTDLYTHVSDEREEIGNIYLGRVEKVLPGIQAAFVSIGRGKNGFIQNEQLKESKALVEKEMRISSLLSEGQKIMVQLIKESSGSKGPRLTDIIEITGKYIVYMPEGNYIAVSKKIEDPREREHWQQVGKELLRNREGLIVRTNCKGTNIETIKEELTYLREVWQEIKENYNRKNEPSLLFSNDDYIDFITRDLNGEEGDECIVDDRKTYQDIKQRLSLYQNTTISLHYYMDRGDLFSTYGIDREIEKALDSNVWLKNGASIKIEEAEALTIIDVNSTKFTGKQSKEDTIIKVNEQAAKEIARQLKLRNIGGIIIIDFINMKSEKGRQKVLVALQEALKKDKHYTKIFGYTALGLLEMTRKQARVTLREGLQKTCTVCGGSGHVLSEKTIVSSLERALLEYKGIDAEGVWVETSPNVIDLLNQEKRIPILEQELGVSLFVTKADNVKSFNIRHLGSVEDIKLRLEAEGKDH